MLFGNPGRCKDTIESKRKEMLEKNFEDHVNFFYASLKFSNSFKFWKRLNPGQKNDKFQSPSQKRITVNIKIGLNFL